MTARSKSPDIPVSTCRNRVVSYATIADLNGYRWSPVRTMVGYYNVAAPQTRSDTERLS